jgi:hypothetical protein
MLDFYTLAIRTPAIYWGAYFTGRVAIALAVLIIGDSSDKVEALCQLPILVPVWIIYLQVALSERRYGPLQLELRLLLICFFLYINNFNVLFLVPYILRLL